jgi:hypothetical protein
VGGIVLQMVVAFLHPLVSRDPRVTFRSRLKFLLAFPLLIAAAAGAGYAVLPEEQQEAVKAAAETLTREAVREAKALDVEREAERTLEDVREARPVSARAVCLLVAMLAVAGALAALLWEGVRRTFGLRRLRRRSDGASA